MLITNWPLLFRAVHHIITHPDEYDQTLWRAQSTCNSTRCVAGWVAHFAHYQDVPDTTCLVVATHAGEHAAMETYRYEDIRWVLSTEDAALNALGVNPQQRERVAALFSGHYSWEDVLEVLAALAEEDRVVLPDIIAQEMDHYGVAVARAADA